jgi:hypothetical protein
MFHLICAVDWDGEVLATRRVDDDLEKEGLSPTAGDDLLDLPGASSVDKWQLPICPGLCSANF